MNTTFMLLCCVCVAPCSVCRTTLEQEMEKARDTAVSSLRGMQERLDTLRRRNNQLSSKVHGLKTRLKAAVREKEEMQAAAVRVRTTFCA